MAATKVPQSSTITVKVQKGLTSTGNPAYVTRNYSCKAAATDQELYDVAQAIMSLQAYPVVSVNRVDDALLLNM